MKLTTDNGKSYQRLYTSLILSEAWRDLTPQAKELYIIANSQIYNGCGKAERDELNSSKYISQTDKQKALCFFLNYDKLSRVFNFLPNNKYKQGKQRLYMQYTQELIEHGFIKCLADLSHKRKKNIYALSALWQQYGQAGFEIPISDKTQAMIRKENQGDKNTTEKTVEDERTAELMRKAWREYYKAHKERIKIQQLNYRERRKEKLKQEREDESKSKMKM